MESIGVGIARFVCNTASQRPIKDILRLFCPTREHTPIAVAKLSRLHVVQKLPSRPRTRR